MNEQIKNVMGPAIFLFLLSPFLAEFLLGASTISHWQGIIPVIVLYGGGSVFIREVSIRMGGRPLQVLLLGFIFGVIEEGFVFQTLFHPNIFGVDKIGGRYFDINWIFAIWVLGYHAIWSILIPIYTSGVIFSSSRKQPWLSKPGVIFCFLSYVVGAFAIGHFIRANLIPGFVAPSVGVLFVCALIFVAILGLIKASRLPRNISTQSNSKRLFAFGATGLVAACLWFSLLYLPDFLKYGSGFLLVLIAWPIVGFLMVRCLNVFLETASPSEIISLFWGALFVSSLHGFRATSGSSVDHLSQGIAALVALICLVLEAMLLGSKIVNGGEKGI